MASLLLLLVASVSAFTPPKVPLPRRDALVSAAAGAASALLRGGARPAIAAAGATSLLRGSTSVAAEPFPKRKNLAPTEMAKVVREDIEKNQFLVTGKLTRDVYDETGTEWLELPTLHVTADKLTVLGPRLTRPATFTDEIDTYTLDKVPVTSSNCRHCVLSLLHTLTVAGSRL